ncbi:hypothetical protein N836_20735 [Leptolyngbya sp. Heron Island J]|nr:hypothetical protein N836_20735 [Leptolyngbya sp. Heron Island J]
MEIFEVFKRFSVKQGIPQQETPSFDQFIGLSTFNFPEICNSHQ